MNDSQHAAELAELEANAEIRDLLEFEPAPRQATRAADGWSPELRRRFSRADRSPGKACKALGKRRSGIDKLHEVACDPQGCDGVD